MNNISLSTFKIIFIGDTSVGKTLLVSRLIYDKYPPTINTHATIGAGFFSILKMVGNKKIRVNIWDTAGQERYRSMVSLYYRGSDLCVIVFDMNDYKIEDVEGWIIEYKNRYDNVVNDIGSRIVLVGNKCDLLLTNIYPDDINQLVDKYKDDITFFTTSAYTGENVDKLSDFIYTSLVNDRMSINANINFSPIDLSLINNDIGGGGSGSGKSGTIRSSYCC